MMRYLRQLIVETRMIETMVIDGILLTWHVEDDYVSDDDSSC